LSSEDIKQETESTFPGGKIAKKTVWKSAFLFGTQITVPYCQKYIPTNCIFGDFAHWVLLNVYLTYLSFLA